MPININISIESNLFIETCCYLGNTSLDSLTNIFKNLNQTELNVLSDIKKQSNPCFLCEFFTHSPDKSFDGVVKFINDLSLKSFIYYYNNENIPYKDITINSESEIIFLKSTLNKILIQISNYINAFLDPHIYTTASQEIFDNLKKASPLEVAQEYMGKRFARVSDYTEYYFVPSKYFESQPMRFFNDTCLLLITPLTPIESKFSLDEISTILKIIGDPTRLSIMTLLKEKAMYGKEIADILDIKAPTITHHIDQLNKINLLYTEQIGQIKYFSLNRKKFASLLNSLNQFLI